MLEKVNQILRHSCLPALKDSSDYYFLGEGAWHAAYRAVLSEGDYVIRIPKPVAYDRMVEYHEESLLAEYDGAEWYYRTANRAVKGICPEFYHYHVSRELTYTIESYMGETLNLSAATKQQMYDYGFQLGLFYKKMDSLPLERQGFGYLKWNGTEASGELEEDPIQYLIHEKAEYQQELDNLLRSDLPFRKNLLKQKVEELLNLRQIEKFGVTLSNQDTSPENLIINGQRAKLIDPVPIIYSGVSLAANHIHNYEVTFPLYRNAPRYKRHQFHLYKNQLSANSQGFREGYVEQSEEMGLALEIERMLKLLSMAHVHYQKTASNTLSREQQIRMGNLNEVKERLMLLLGLLENYEVRDKVGVR
ncbi:hypothetical protein M1K46_22140 [Fictibacillus sp. WQ 8-8]|uniref:hypothetical protein n=1 Tax=Fictibacillus sp. WQ 8-8 TaxID=2938788 RepID=UPI00210A71A7|nr:hypothetical protein [Fictibacillus sp. WQ 8-8]MCQ6268302.1 hypothetical protein [Fictibacillus sp. WQ 8-8]